MLAFAVRLLVVSLLYTPFTESFVTTSRARRVVPSTRQSPFVTSINSPTSASFANLRSSSFKSNDESPDFRRRRQWKRPYSEWIRLRRKSVAHGIRKVGEWQRSKRRRLLTAAVFALSVLFMSQRAIDNSYSPYVPAATEIQRIVKSSAVADTALMPPRGGGSAISTLRPPKNAKPVIKIDKRVSAVSTKAGRKMVDAISDLRKYMAGPKSDTIWLLLATALITPVCKRLGTSPILGFLASGMLLGPNGLGLISGIHTTETLAELGIVFFLFEMGIELSVDRLMSMRKDVFGLGLLQFMTTSLVIGLIGMAVGLPGNANVVLGGGLALSSSAFVLQLLKDKNQLATRFGKAAFGILLFQDLAVVPLLVVTPILAGSGTGLASALGSAVLKASMALGAIFLAGRFLLSPTFRLVAQAQSRDSFLGVVLLTVLSMSFMTEGLGLSNTLGAFLAGVLLSETKYRYQVEADIAPFRGVLLGLFFVTVGFEIDFSLIASQLPQVASIVIGIMALKSALVAVISRGLFRLSPSTSIQTGLIVSQGGEFAFVAFGLARSLGILDSATTKLMLTSVSLTMALTPFVASVGSKIAKTLEEKSDFTHYLGQDRDANEIKESDDFVVVVGYGIVGKVVTDLLDRKLVKYVGIDINPSKSIQARNAGLPIFYGDIGRPEVADAFNVGKAKAVIVCIAEKQQATRAVIALRRMYPNLKIFARAADVDHAERLQNTLDVVAMVPILPQDNLLLTLPFGGAVMKALGIPAEEVNAIVEAKRKEVLRSGEGLEESEEEAALAQLAIKPADTGSNQTDGEKMVEAAAERREKALEKSPFVAKVIEEICPDSVSVDDESKIDDDDEVVMEVEALEGDPVAEAEAEEEMAALEEIISSSSGDDTIVNETSAFQ